MKVPQRCKQVRYLTSHYDVSARRACHLSGLSESVYYYPPRRDEQFALRQRIRDIAHSRIQYGYKRIHVMLKREGIHVNHKRVQRLYCLEGLQVRPRRPRRHVSAARRQPPKVKATRPKVAWSMDFVSDQLQDGHRFRALTVVDVFTRESLAIYAARGLGAQDVVPVLRRIAARRGAPRRIYSDNGSEFAGRMVDLWAYVDKVTLEFSRPGKPTDNAYIESFNGSLQDECLNTHRFEDLTDAQEKLQAWQQEYNESRPHKALDGLTPLEYRARWDTEKTEIL